MQYPTYQYAEQNNSPAVGVSRGGLLFTGNGGDCCDGGATERYFEVRDDLSYQRNAWGAEHRLKAGVNWKRVQHGGFDNAFKVGQDVFDTAAPFNAIALRRCRRGLCGRTPRAAASGRTRAWAVPSPIQLGVRVTVWAARPAWLSPTAPGTRPSTLRGFWWPVMSR